MNRPRVMHLQVMHAPGGTCWVRLVGANGAIVLQSEVYANASNARRAARTLGKQLGLPVVDGGEEI